jgi:hypothetical protein
MATLEMKYVKSPSLCKEKSYKKSSRGQYGLRFSTDKSRMWEKGGRGGNEMANCNRRPFYLVRVAGVENGGDSVDREATRSRKRTNTLKVRATERLK